MAYNRYHGNSGQRERIEEPDPSADSFDASRRLAGAAAGPGEHTVPVKKEGAAPSGTRHGPAPYPGAPFPPGQRPPPSAPWNGLGRLLSKVSPQNLAAEDYIILLILYLLYRETGDRDFLIMAGVFLLT